MGSDKGWSVGGPRANFIPITKDFMKISIVLQKIRGGMAPAPPSSEALLLFLIFGVNKKNVSSQLSRCCCQ